jgi:hypothetical protein
MIRKKEAFLKIIETIKGPQKRLIALRKPNLDIFSAHEIDIVNQVIHALWDKTAEEVSKSTHGLVWHIYNNHDLIPYESVHISDKSTDADTTRAKELIEQYGWDDV